jgi:hypothetical protein
MRLLILSDVHGHAEKARSLSNIVTNDSPDALVICGDITHFGNLAQASAILREFARLTTTVLFVPGNCDPPQLALEPVVEGTTNLHGRCLSILGVNFIGVGGCIPTPFGTPFELPEDEIASLLGAARRACGESESTILVSHDPPHGTKADRTFIGHHVGSKSVRDFIEKTSPSVVACGHIHESRALESYGATTVVNPGPFHRGYYALAEVGEKVSVSLEVLK